MKNKMLVVVIFLVVSLIVYFLYWYARYSMEGYQLESDVALILRRQTDSYNRSDAWGTQIKYNYVVSEYQRVATAHSAGPDCEFGTWDDLKAKKIDYNKSKIVGRWAGQKAKELGSGIIKGLKDKSPFKKQ